MKITMTDHYALERNLVSCDELDQCERHYCRKHRLLYKDCDTLKRGMEGDRDVIGGIHGVYELGECPECEAESRTRRH